MPTYEYECQKCKKRFEIFHSMTAEPVKSCPYCKGEVKRLISRGVGIIFKGSGFYATDYRKNNKPEGSTCPMNKRDPTCKSCPANKPANRQTR